MKNSKSGYVDATKGRDSMMAKVKAVVEGKDEENKSE